MGADYNGASTVRKMKKNRPNYERIHRIHTKMREEFIALGATTRVISSTDHIFHKDFRNLLQTIQIFCAKGKKKILNLELIFDKYFRLFGLNALFQKGMSNKLVCSLLG